VSDPSAASEAAEEEEVREMEEAVRQLQTNFLPTQARINNL
jgi:hypothetical protein